MGDTVVQIAVRDPRAPGKAHRRAPGAAGQATACGRPTFTLTESVPLTQTAPEDRCTFCWSGETPPAPVAELASQDVPVGRDHPATSHTAADMMRPHVSRQRQVVLDHIAAMGGSTVDEVQAATGGIHQSTSAAASWLERRGFIQPLLDDRNRPVTRDTRSGRPARVMVLTRKGQRALGAESGPEWSDRGAPPPWPEDRQPSPGQWLAWLDTLSPTRRLTAALRVRVNAATLRACPVCAPPRADGPAASGEWLAWLDGLPGEERLAAAERVLADNLAATDCFIRNHPRPPGDGPE